MKAEETVVTVSMPVMRVGDGYKYLLRTVAAGDWQPARPPSRSRDHHEAPRAGDTLDQACKRVRSLAERTAARRERAERALGEAATKWVSTAATTSPAPVLRAEDMPREAIDEIGS
ncbi:hypothetical protein [Cryobacterium melibiosiphilum]|uniref:hypothetical protein n=1 Tax=Cryobacterium melibiosiphilum TaxID=995039 RepID=UPI0018F7AA23|nr:hypothetical protein [Cryobacterium melibiosiphilum]